MRRTPVKKRTVTVPITVHIPLADLAAIDAAAQKLGVSRNYFSKGAIRREVERTKLATKTDAEVAK